MWRINFQLSLQISEKIVWLTIVAFLSRFCMSDQNMLLRSNSYEHLIGRDEQWEKCLYDLNLSAVE